MAVALSGGVDSAVTAMLLAEQGYEVIGVHMHLWREPPEEGALPLPDPAVNARRVARALDIPFYVVDLVRPFKRLVVDPFIAGYRAGRTPNPCLFCNRRIKYGALLRWAIAHGARWLATGHYARVRLAPDGRTWQLLRGVDRRKDQSYVLYALGQEELARVMWPLGEKSKDWVRRVAAERGLPVTHAVESQDLCFIPDNDYRRFLRRYAPQALVPGPILDSSGREIGRHKGLAGYTVGQRRGLGIAAPEALYVLRLDPSRNALIVGPRRELGRDRLIAEDVHWVSGRPPDGPVSAGVKIRYRAPPAPAVVVPMPGARAEVRFARPLRDITPGQGAVFYDGEVVLGGGIIGG